MAYETIIVETKGRVGLVRLNRPNALNALNAQLIDELSAALDGFEADDGIGCIVITGSEKAFAAGADIKEMQSKTYMQAYKEDFISSWDRVGRCRKPVVAAVAGFALGGGCELAMMCDIIIAADTAKFGQPEIKLGVMPGSGGTQRLIRQVGKAKAMEMCLTGRMMDAAEAERANLVGRVVPAASLMEEAMKTAEAIASMSLPAAMMTKETHQPRLRDHAGRRHPLRAARVPLHVRHGRPEGGHGGLRREAQTRSSSTDEGSAQRPTAWRRPSVIDPGEAASLLEPKAAAGGAPAASASATSKGAAYGQHLIGQESRAQDASPHRDQQVAPLAVSRRYVRKVEEALASGDKAAAKGALAAAEPILMRTAQKGVIHKRAAARKVSRLAARVKAMA